MNLLLAGTIGELLDKIFAGFDMAVFSFFGNIQWSYVSSAGQEKWVLHWYLLL